MSSPVASAASIRKIVPPGLHSRSNIEDTVQQITISGKTFFAVRSEIKLRGQTNHCKPLCVKSHSVRKKSASIIQSVRCGAAGQSQTQTVTRESSTITVAPQAKEKSPELDDGGSGLPPRDDDDGGGGGGGGGGWGGGFFFFGFLALLGFLKDQEDEGSYQDSRRRSKNY